jgi:hypothetical protein
MMEVSLMIRITKSVFGANKRMDSSGLCKLRTISDSGIVRPVSRNSIKFQIDQRNERPRDRLAIRERTVASVAEI